MKSLVVEGGEDPARALRAFFAGISWREKNQTNSLGSSLPGLYRCPTKGVSVTGAVGVRALVKYRSGQKLAGGASIPSKRE